MGDAEEFRLDELTPQQREVISRRYLGENPRSLAEVGAEMNLSREEVRALEVAAWAVLAVRPPDEAA